MYRRYPVEVELTEDLLGTQPTDLKARENLKRMDEDEEVPVSEIAKQTFYINDGHPVVMDYEIKGFFKSAGATLPMYLGVPGTKNEFPSERLVKSRIDRWLFIAPRFIPFMDGASNTIKSNIDDSITHPIRAMTRQGERITLIDSDLMFKGTRLQFTVSVIENCPITGDGIYQWLTYGEEGIGLLGWRTAGFGRFMVISFEDEYE